MQTMMCKLMYTKKNRITSSGFDHVLASDIQLCMLITERRLLHVVEVLIGRKRCFVRRKKHFGCYYNYRAITDLES